MRPRFVLRDGPEPGNDLGGRLQGWITRRNGSAAAFGLRAGRTGGAMTLGSSAASAALGARQAEKPCLLRRSRAAGHGAGMEPARGMGIDHVQRTQAARQHRNVLIQSPWEHRAMCGGNAVHVQRTLRWKKALRSGTRALSRGNTDRGSLIQTTREARRSVNAESSKEGLRKEDAVTSGTATGEGKASKGIRHRERLRT